MKIFTCITALVFFTTVLNAQITKGNWLMGGNASYSASTTKGGGFNYYRSSLVEFKPDIGYFVIDRLAGGIVLSILGSKEKNPEPDGTTNKSTQTILGIGPFLRYYFLDVDNKVNIFLSTNLTRTFHFIKQNSQHMPSSNSFSYEAAIGAVVFLNSSVGCEAAIGYNRAAYLNNDNDVKTDKILFRIGLQIHLEKQ